MARPGSPVDSAIDHLLLAANETRRLSRKHVHIQANEARKALEAAATAPEALNTTIALEALNTTIALGEPIAYHCQICEQLEYLEPCCGSGICICDVYGGRCAGCEVGFYVCACKCQNCKEPRPGCQCTCGCAEELMLRTTCLFQIEE